MVLNTTIKDCTTTSKKVDVKRVATTFINYIDKAKSEKKFMKKTGSIRREF